MHEQLKRELQTIRLSDAQKVQIEKRLEERPRKTIQWSRIVTPLAIALALFLVVIGLQQQQSVQSGAQTAFVAWQPLTLELIIWGTVTYMIAMCNYTVFIFCVLYVKRIENNPFVRAFKGNMTGIKIWRLVVTMFGFGAVIFLGIRLLPFGLLYVQVIAALLFIPLVFFIQLLMTRHGQWPVCPHCGVELSRKQLRKRGFTGTIGSCEHCQQQIFEMGKMKVKAMRIYFFYPILLIVMPQIPTLLFTTQLAFVGVFLVQVVLTLIYIDPYTLKFAESDHQEPLW